MDYYALVNDPTFFTLLLNIDKDTSSEFRRKGCVECQSVLHAANFERKVTGLPGGTPEEVAIRFSFCCSGENCRKRHTPPSVRFLTGRRYLAVIFVLASVFHHGVTTGRVDEVAAAADVSRSSIRRWLQWWRDMLPKSTFWRAHQSCLHTVSPTAMPSSLFAAFVAGSALEVMTGMLRFLGRFGHTDS